jgi:hypothetical protein
MTALGSLAMIGQILRRLVLVKGGRCYGTVGSGCHSMLNKAVRGMGSCLGHELLQPKQREACHELALDDEEDRKSGLARAPMVGADAAGHDGSDLESRSFPEAVNRETLAVWLVVNARAVAGRAVGNSP